jgi:carbamoyltransferase
MYTILKEYEKLTGMGGVMNTSLNIHWYPLVGTIEQAFFTLENSGLKNLVLENYLISKK